MVSLHLLEGSEEDGRGEERCAHITDLVETYGRMSETGKSDEDDGQDHDDDDEDEDDGNGEAEKRGVGWVASKGGVVCYGCGWW